MDLGHANSPPPAEEGPLTSTMHVDRNHHPVGTWEQVLGRRLVPRLSIGTLQLSIRCSSIHPRLPKPLLSGEHFRGLEGWIRRPR
jgi:hypothetical protein